MNILFNTLYLYLYVNIDVEGKWHERATEQHLIAKKNIKSLCFFSFRSCRQPTVWMNQK